MTGVPEMEPGEEGKAMTMGEAFATCMRKYADFSGRARRAEFWWFYLVRAIIGLPLIIAVYVVAFVEIVRLAVKEGEGGSVGSTDVDWVLVGGVFGLAILVGLAFLLPSLAVTVRRLHDMGQPGWWILLEFVGLGIVPLVMAISDSQPFDNAWGPDPKAAERDAGTYSRHHTTPPASV